MKKDYYKQLNIIRLVSCIAILLYHLGVLKGGFLAVCTFFVISGYLSVVSLFNKSKLSFKDYYFNRLKKLYLPLVIVVLSTITVIHFIPEVYWFNMKPETTSVLGGYNNFWQLHVNLDYFARHIDSPFMHLWYIAILLQFDLIFPFIFLGFKKFGQKISKFISLVLLFILSALGVYYLFKTSSSSNIMNVYYNTFTRVFSLMFGVFLGFMHHYYGNFVFIKNKIIQYVIFSIYLILMVLSFIFIKSDSKYMVLSLVLVSLISLRLIDYATTNKNELFIIDKIIKLVSDISYEVYLVQYPVIYIFQYVSMNSIIKYFVIVLVIFIISYFMHFCFNNKNEKLKVFKYIGLVILSIFTLYGGYLYVISVDYTKEMKALERQLEENQSLVKESQENYTNSIKEEQASWEEKLAELESDSEKLEELVKSLPVVGIGDSVMLGAVPNLYKTFKNGYFDAKVSRSTWKVSGIIDEMTDKGLLGNPIIINMGANGDCSYKCKKEIMDKLKEKDVFWVNTTNLVNVNETLLEFSKEYDNLHLIDWYNISLGHDEYFYADGIHLTVKGRKAYTEAIYSAMFDYYSTDYKNKKDKIYSEHENILLNKITFYGDTILLNSFDNIKSVYKDGNFVVDKEITYDKLVNSINESISNNSITNKIVFVFNNKFSNEEYKKLVDLCKGHEVYIVNTNKDSIKVNGVSVLNFYKEISKHKDYLMPDKKHLSSKGSKALSEFLNKNIG